MSVRIDLQTAPEAFGTVGAPSAWGDASTTVVTVTGVYRGEESKTFTFDAVAGGTIGSGTLSLDWDDGDQTGRLELGSGYTAGTPILFHDGLLVAFSAGTIAAGTSTFTLAVTGGRRLVPDHIVIESREPGPTLNNWSGGTRRSSDQVFGTSNGDMRTTKVANNRAPSFETDWATGDVFYRMLRGEGRRHDWTIGEDYNAHTRFLWRGGGVHPFIGPKGVFTRASVATYYDALAGLYRSVASGEPRVIPGLAGKSVQLSALAVTNLLTQFHPKNGTPGWSAGAGAPTLTWDEGHPTILDPADTHWAEPVTRGTERVHMPAGSSINSGDGIVALGADTAHTAQTWLDGRGRVTVHLRSGFGAASVSRGSSTVTLDGVPTQVVVTGTVLAADTRVDINIVADDASVIYLGPSQIEAGYLATSIVQTNGATATRAAEVLQFPFAMPADVGTLAIDFYWPGLNTGVVGNTVTLLQATGLAGTDRFALWYAENTDALLFYLITPGGAPGTHPVALTTGHHQVVLVWKRSTTAGNVRREIYLDRVLALEENTTAWGTGFGTGFEIGGVLATNHPLQDFRVERVRVDDAAWTLADVQESYDRLRDDDWLHVLREFGGREFLLSQFSPQQLDFANLDKIIARMQFLQSRCHADSLLVDR